MYDYIALCLVMLTKDKWAHLYMHSLTKLHAFAYLKSVHVVDIHLQWIRTGGGNKKLIIVTYK